MIEESRAYMPQAKSVEWETPQDFFDKLNKEFDFTLDSCASFENAKCAKFYTIKDDGLSKSWTDERVFMNPPYGNALKHWTKKAFEETTNPFSRAELVVGLLPVRSDTRWFHNYIYNKTEIRFLKGRLKFGGSEYSATFPSMVVIWRGDKSNDR